MHYNSDYIKKYKEFGRSIISALNSFDFKSAGYSVFLVGDILWINEIQGIMSPSSLFFCPQCERKKRNLSPTIQK